MNKFQQERQMAFGNQSFADEQKRRVIEAVHQEPKRKKAWLPIVVALSIVAITAFLFFVPNLSLKQQQINANLQQLAEQQIGERTFKQMETIEPFLTENDALVVSKIKLDEVEEWNYQFQHATKLNDEWQIDLQFTYPLPMDTWEYIYINDELYYFGLLQNSKVDKILVGDDQVTYWPFQDGIKIWLAKPTSVYTPVYYEIAGERQRQQTTFDRATSILPFIDGNEQKQAVINYKYTMTRGNDEYMEFPLLIDPYYYAENSYEEGDVIVIESNNGLEVTRIIDTAGRDVKIAESTIILGDGSNAREFYSMANYNGDTSIYDKSTQYYKAANRDEVFVFPDNWSGEDFYRGAISKMNIKGKVLGYDLNNVSNTMNGSELKLYDELQQVTKAMDIEGINNAALKKILSDASPKTIAKLYYYAYYVEDYETMYALLAQDKKTTNFNQWKAVKQQVTTKSSKQHQLVSIYYLSKATWDETNMEAKYMDEGSGQTIFEQFYVKEEGVWKVK